MPLSPPVGRQHLHTRRVTCQGFFREDGLWDIEGHITDEKTYEHSNEWRGALQPGDFVHDMSIRLTVDHRFIIVDVEAVTDKSPYQICGNVAPDFKKDFVRGAVIAPGASFSIGSTCGIAMPAASGPWTTSCRTCASPCG